jgi:hypothetical protein
LRPRAFDVYEIIGRTRPKVVNAHLVSKDDPRIKSRYRVSEVFDRLLIRRDTAAP